MNNHSALLSFARKKARRGPSRRTTPTDRPALLRKKQNFSADSNKNPQRCGEGLDVSKTGDFDFRECFVANHLAKVVGIEYVQHVTINM